MKNVRNRYVTLGDLQESGSRIISSSLVMMLSNLDVFISNRRKYNTLFLTGSLLGLCVLTKMLLVRKGKINPNILNVYAFTQGAVIGSLVTTSIIDLAVTDKTKLITLKNIKTVIPRVINTVLFKTIIKNIITTLLDPLWKIFDRLLGIPLYDEKTLLSAVNSIGDFDIEKLKQQVSRMMATTLLTSVIFSALILYKYRNEISLSKLQEIVKEKEGVTRILIGTAIPLMFYFILNSRASFQRTQRLNEFKQNLKKLIQMIKPKKFKFNIKHEKNRFMKISLLKDNQANLKFINSNNSFIIPISNLVINRLDDLITRNVSNETWSKVFTSIKDTINIVGLEKFKSYISKIIIVSDPYLDNAFVMNDPNDKDKYLIYLIIGREFSRPDVISKHITAILLHEFGHVKTSTFIFFKVYAYLAYISLGVIYSTIDMSSDVKDFAEAVVTYMSHVLGRLGEILADSYAIKAGYGKYLAEILHKLTPDDYRTLHTLNNDVHGIPDERVKAIDKVADAILSSQ